MNANAVPSSERVRPRARVVKRALLGLLLALLLFELYARFPSTARLRPLVLPADTEELVLIFHGTGGLDEPTLIALTQRFDSLGRERSHRRVQRYLWSPFSDNIFRAAAHGTHLGHALGRELSGLHRLRSLRLIAHSAGSYILDPLCESYRSLTLQPAHIEMTFLDPIGTTGTWDYGYGYRNHGRCADFASATINTDDPVPGTNAPAEQAANLDVTQAPERAAFRGEGHVWPVQYYLDHLTGEQATPRLRNHQLFPRGSGR